MGYITSQQPIKEAKVCIDNKCVIVYNETAEIVNTIAIAASLFVAAALIVKALE